MPGRHFAEGKLGEIPKGLVETKITEVRQKKKVAPSNWLLG